MSRELYNPDRSKLYRFKIDKLLGKGGSGAVYRAIDTKNGDVVALKLFHSTYFRNRAHVKEFERSVSKIRKAKHENVTEIYEFLYGDEGECLSQEYVDGPDLRWYIVNRPWDLQERLVICAQICNGLQFIHENGYTHHDIKPSNILFTRKGKVKVSDFSVAKGRLLGFFESSLQELITPMFVAPEIIRKEKATKQSDLYALGVTFYVMFTGHYPFAADHIQQLYNAHLKQRPQHPTVTNRKCPQALGDIIMKLLEKEPAKRFSDCDEVRIALSGVGLSRI